MLCLIFNNPNSLFGWTLDRRNCIELVKTKYAFTSHLFVVHYILQYVIMLSICYHKNSSFSSKMRKIEFFKVPFHDAISSFIQCNATNNFSRSFDKNGSVKKPWITGFVRNKMAWLGVALQVHIQFTKLGK